MADDPDEAQRRGAGGADDGTDGGVDAFDAIVSGWRRDGPVPQWPADPDPVTAPGRSGPATGPATPDAAVPDPAGADPARPDPDPAGPDAVAAPGPAAGHRPPTGPGEPVEEHFVPPEPPPLPRLGPPAAVGLGLLVVGLVLVTTPGWLGVGPVYGLPLGLVTIAAALGWLVLRLWPTPPDDEDDDGARL